MKQSIGVLILLAFFIQGCGNASPENEPVNEEEILVDQSAQAMGSSEIIEEEQESVEIDEWQINHYAEYILNEKIAESAESYDVSRGDNLYYETLDAAGGFANVTGAFEGWHEFVLWRMDSGEDLVIQMTVGCGPVCDYDFKFFKGNGNEIAEIKPDLIMPMGEITTHQNLMHTKALEKYPDLDYAEDCQLVFNLPQKGTSIEVDIVIGADEVQVPILQLGWNKSTFFVNELYESID